MVTNAVCEQYRQENAQYLSEFRAYLETQKLSLRTIEKHIGNISFFLNNYLIYDARGGGL